MSEDDPDYYLHDPTVYPIADPINIELYVYDDEKIDFIATTNFTLKKIQAAQAIDAIENDSFKIFITKDEIESWLNVHYDFYWSLQNDWNNLAFKKFQNLYSKFQYLEDNFEFIDQAKIAVEEYQPFNDEWLNKYNRLFYAGIIFYPDFYEVWNDNPFILMEGCSNVFLVGDEFKCLYDFTQFYSNEINRGIDLV